MRWVVGIWALELLIGLGFAYAAFQFTAWYRRQRLRPKQPLPPPGFTRTDEIHIDPTTGVRQRVWYNPQTGERFYQTLDPLD